VRTGTTIRRKIDRWGRLHIGSCVCDLCLAREIGHDPNDKGMLTRALAELSAGGLPSFSRYRGKCDRCGDPGMVSTANRLAWAWEALCPLARRAARQTAPSFGSLLSRFRAMES
jgi:hypothetical protein